MSTTSVLTDSRPFSRSAPTAADRQRRVQNGVAAAAAAALGVGALALAGSFTWRHGALFLLGGFLGLSLYHALFGFTSAWRALISERRGAGLRAQLLMLAVAVVLFYPVLARGRLLGQPVHGELGPVGVSVAVGAFLFGVGMQLGGGCASGTLYTIGGGSIRMLVTLAAFIAGSALGAYHLPWWSARPSFGQVSLLHAFGLGGALTATLAAFAVVAAITVAVERARHGRAGAPRPSAAAAGAGAPLATRLVRGPWPLAWGAIALAIGNFATLALAGRPWGITSAFALWGSKVAGAAGADVAHWAYWSSPARKLALEQGVFHDITTVMDFGIVLGALLASALAHKFAPSWKVPLRSLLAAVVGGLLLGYGARLAYGCNIGAYFSGIASSSLHGWLWLAAAFAGSILGTRLRPAFGLSRT